MVAKQPLKVLQVGSSLHDWGGIERYVAYLTSGLLERGHEVTVTAPEGSRLLNRLPEGSERLCLSVRRKHDLAALRSYLKLFRQRRFDIVHVHFNPDFLVAGWAARLARQPCTILTRHVALPWSGLKVRLYGPLFDHIIPVSDAVRRKLATSGIDQAKMTVAKAGCPALVSAGPRASAGPYRVGSFCRLVPEKGLDVLIAAASMVPQTQFHIYGSGPIEAELQRAAPANVIFEGFREDVADCMGPVDAVAIPSMWEEAFPYAALEAMSLAKPVIASRIGGLPEIVDDGVTGLLFERGNPKDLAAQVQALASDRSRGAAMGAAGQRVHSSEYTVQRMAERIEDVYLKVAQR